MSCFSGCVSGADESDDDDKQQVEATREKPAALDGIIKLRSSGPNSRGNGVGVLDECIAGLNATMPGQMPITIEDIRAQNFSIPSTIYRAARNDASSVLKNGIPSGRSSYKSDDEYLAAIICHTARTCGSEGQVPSFSADFQTSRRFVRPGNNMSFVNVDTTHDPLGFRTIPDILINDVERLVQNGLVRKATVIGAIRHLFDYQEKEVFYVRGNLPSSMIGSAMPA